MNSSRDIFEETMAKYCPDWDYPDLHSILPEMDLDLKTGILTVYPSLPTVSGTRKDESLTMVQLPHLPKIDFFFFFCVRSVMLSIRVVLQNKKLMGSQAKSSSCQCPPRVQPPIFPIDTARALEEDACVCQKTQQNSVTKHEPDAPQLELLPVFDVQINLQPTEEPLANKHDPDASPSESPSIVKVEGDDNQGLKPEM
ncbi:uncharacterized protein PGTG_12467 [Puccinia graminis f. sp. tritici CRL 75-36-700-3]|uniref:Uncharacterized protein n=1 Tax=Puccinia graminis f. sp. tritici (strain CRL 75-36-700-3 / race SCCL) TaxID=418459 RepID=E3KQD6_PUCGT|nr:uncharacterized protein PGTG_12467 [Puccinia graminis f. sp. tritici CRL 75-36-700-3]EFP86511.2 hypothetical protein PGTG_12467 [Puccinia graminis f. sp. tritici CRL 75-36-700-3]